MKRKRVALLFWGVLVVLLVFTFKVEHIEEVCAKTGSSVRYNRYFSVITTKKKLTQSWVEEALEAEKLAIPDREWRRTMGNTRTTFSFTRAHGRAPATYQIRGLDLEHVREDFGSAETLRIAKTIGLGDAEERKAAIKLIYAQ